MRPRTLPLFLAFFVMGFVDAVGPMVAFARKSFALSNAQAGLLTFFPFIAFAALSVPGGILAARKGKRFLLLLSLGASALGLALATTTMVWMPTFALLLGSLLVLGVGMAFLQVAGNPMMREVSEEGAFARNLTFAQFIKSLASAANPFVLGFLTARMGSEHWGLIFPIFLLVTLLCLGANAGLHVEEAPQETGATASLGTSFALLKDPFVAAVVLGIFLYVGAEVGMAAWSAAHLQGFGLDPKGAQQWGPGAFFIGLAVGRGTGSLLLRVLSARTALVLSAALGLVGVGLCFGAPSASVAMAAPLVAGLGFANIWPLVFALAIDARPARGSEVSGLMVMAIAGGAVLPALMGKVADLSTLRMAFTVPLLCFAYLLGFALLGRARREEVA